MSEIVGRLTRRTKKDKEFLHKAKSTIEMLRDIRDGGGIVYEDHPEIGFIRKLIGLFPDSNIQIITKDIGVAA
jgi:hypothetical protein